MDDFYLKHYGVKGMKWGIRRYQSADGTLTDAGRKREAKSLARDVKLYTYKETTKHPKRKKVVVTKKLPDPLIQQKLMKNKAFKEIEAKLGEAKKQFRKAHEFAYEFNSNPKLKEHYYEQLAEKEFNNRISKSGENKQSHKDLMNEIRKDIKYEPSFYDRQAFELYCKDKGVDVFKYQEQTQKAQKDYQKATRDAVHEYLGIYENVSVGSIKSSDYRVKRSGDYLNNILSRTLTELNNDEAFDEKYYLPDEM